MFDEIFEGIKRIDEQEPVEEVVTEDITSEKEWFIYIPKQGLWLINYTGDSKEEAEAAYLKQSGDESLPSGSKIYDESGGGDIALPDEPKKIEKFDVARLYTKDFLAAAKKYGLDPKFLGKKFSGFGKRYTLVGADSKYKGAPFVAIQQGTGVDYRLSAEDLTKAFTEHT